MSSDADNKASVQQIREAWNTDNFMITRVDIDQLMNRIELFLTNKRKYLVHDPDTEQWREEEKKYGEPMANPLGIQGILSLIEMRVNKHTVQGWFDNPRYDDYIYHTRRELAYAIVLNRPRWGINDTDTTIIVDNIMSLIKPFMTRLLNNSERESYAKSMQAREVITHEARRAGFFSRFSGGFGR